jgi:uncharacterized protein (DUF697 family)
MNSEIANESYRVIKSKSDDNTVVQSLSGIFGWPITITADVAVIPFIYIPLWNRIRALYNRTEVDKDTAGKILNGVLSEIFVDIAFDKIMGNVPLIGIYFNAICAKTMTWRLGTLFTMLATRGEEIDEKNVRESMILIRKVFPQSDMFKFVTPDKVAFLKLVSSVTDLSQDGYKKKVIAMLETEYKE